ncbi:IPT/TIG domain-containing protein [Domibacillus indicus]|uniref:IPT/TIG domain-containing protein n=1 Tax=Domibacillus indicus TaxID=1437523 RepID=UPI000617B682|nr:IPT/TIG domain-containing protein [Domibacillus indicus]
MSKKTFFSRFIILIVFSLISMASFSEALANSLVSVNKTVSSSSVIKGDVIDVTLSVTGTPQDTTNVKPNDVILIVDKSGSMGTDNRLNAAKEATKEFIDLMDLSKHRVGIVDFDSYVSSFPLTNDASAAKAYVDTIQLAGSTNTGAAIRQATSMLSNHRPEAQPTIVILTDGAANDTADALNSAAAAKNAGITFYSIALLGANENPDTSAPNDLLKQMSTSAEHHHFVLGSVGLSDVYKKIVEEIGQASAYKVKITDEISPQFEIVPGSYDNNIPPPTVSGNNLIWEIEELKAKTLVLTYKVKAKTDASAGKHALGKTVVDYEDYNQSTYNFISANPIITIENLPPSITNIEANKGLTTGGEKVTITGQNFIAGAKVYFGSYEAAVQSLTDSQIIVTSPIGSQGEAAVKVVNPDNQFASGTFNYYAIPEISYVTPNQGDIAGGNNVSVIGSNFMRGAKVYFNGIEASTTFSTSSKLYAIVPSSSSSGPIAVKVINPDLTETEKTDAYTYTQPAPPPKVELTSLGTSSGQIAGGESIYLFGSNFHKDVKIYFGDVQAPVNYYATSSKIRVTVPSATTAGFVTVKAENPDGSVSELVNAYEYLTPPPLPAPSISYLSENSVLIGEAKTIYLFGSNISPSSKVFIGSQEAPIEFVTASKIRVKVPVSSTPSVEDVTLTNPDGQQATLAGGFSYTEPVKLPAPVIASISPAIGSINGGETITITGQNFQSGAKVYIGTRTAAISSISDTEIVANTPVGLNAGSTEVRVVNPDLQETIITDGYFYEGLKITVTKLSVYSGATKGGNLVYIYGTNFNNAMTVTVNGNKVPYTYLATNRIRIAMPAASAPGDAIIQVDRDGSTGSIMYTYY